MMKKIRTLSLFLIPLLILTGCGQKVSETWQNQYDLGTKYLEEENYEEALAAFTAAIELDSKQADIYAVRGDAYILSGENEEHLSAALADYEQVIELDDAYVQAYLGLADVYIRQREYDKALEILREGLEKTGSDEQITDKIEEMESGTILDSEGKQRRVAHYVDGDLWGYAEFTYNEEGHTIGVAALDAAGNQTEYKDQLFDAQGNLTEHWAASDRDGIVKLIKNTYEYDTDGNCIKHIHYDADENPIYYDLSEYNESGNRIKESTYGIDGDFRGYHLYEYDENNNKITYSSYDENDALTRYHLYEYDENGNLIKESTYDKNGELTSYTTYEYDENGKRISRNRVHL